MQDVGQICWAALKSLPRLAAKNPDMEAKVDRCSLSDMDKFKCIGLSMRTDLNNRRSMVQRKETVEFVTTMVKFSLVKKISGVLMLDKEALLAYQHQVARSRKRRRCGIGRWRHLTCIVSKWTE